MSKFNGFFSSFYYSKAIEVVFTVAAGFFIALNVFWYFEGAIYSEHTDTTQIGSVSAGDTVILQRNVCSTKNLPMSAKRIFVGNNGYVAPVHSVPVDSGICGNIVFPLTIPDYLPIGKYEYRMQLSYELNPLKRVMQELTPIPFEVIK